MLRVFLLIVVGLAGDPEHGKTFHKWGATLAEASERLGVAPRARSSIWSTSRARARQARHRPGDARGDRQGASTAFAKQAGRRRRGVHRRCIGHGSFDGTRRQVQPAGSGHGGRPTSTRCSSKLPTKQIVFVNTSSASGPFVEELSGPGRTIVTATRNGAEQLRDALRRLLRRRAHRRKRPTRTRTSASACSRRSSTPRAR